MTIYETYERRAALANGHIDVYQYEKVPDKFRVQFEHIARMLLGESTFQTTSSDHYSKLVPWIEKELGIRALARPIDRTFTPIADRFYVFLATETVVERYLSVVEMAMVYAARTSLRSTFEAVVKELNFRFQANGFGYHFEGGQIIRADSQLIHAEVVKPALSLLQNPLYRGAQDEFLKAHQHYRDGNIKEALIHSMNSVESVMRSICSKRGWVSEKARPNYTDLTKLCFEKGLIASYWQSMFGNLKPLLDTGINTARNREAGHGQGEEVNDTPPHIASFVLHMTASTIVFLAEAEKALG